MGINDPGSHTEFHLLKNQSIIRISPNTDACGYILFIPVVRNYPICEATHKISLDFYCYKTGTECVDSEKSVTKQPALESWFND